MEKLLFVRRINLFMDNSFFSGGIEYDWPFSKIYFFQNHLDIKYRRITLTIKYSQIKSIEKRFLTVRINHNEPDIYKRIIISGIFLFRDIKNLVEKNKLKIKLKD